jgi:hypothetical protein
MNYGRDDLMAISAVRYCLGRMTYIVGYCSEWLICVWPNLKPSAQAVIKRDIEEAFSRDDEDRAEGREHKTLGHDCDREQWERVRRIWK